MLPAVDMPTILLALVAIESVWSLGKAITKIQKRSIQYIKAQVKEVTMEA